MGPKKTRSTTDKTMRSTFVRLVCLAISSVSLAQLAALAWFLYQNYNNVDAKWPVVVAGCALLPVGLTWLSSVAVLEWVIEWEIHAVMRRFANDYDLRLIDDGTQEMKEAVRGYNISPPLDRRLQRLWAGRRTTYTSIVSGETDGVRIAVFQHSFHFKCGEGGGAPGPGVRLTVCTLTALPTSLPQFHLGPRVRFPAYLPRLRGGIQVTGSAAAQAFAKQYVLLGPNEDQLLHVFSGELVAFFSEHPGWTAQSDGTWFVLWRDKSPFVHSEVWELLKSAILGPRCWLHGEVEEAIKAGLQIGQILNRQG